MRSTTIAPNSSLVAWLNGSSPALSGGGVLNQGGNATNVTIYGTTNNTSLTISGSGAFIGTVDPYSGVV
jgi:hypothetical protein